MIFTIPQAFERLREPRLDVPSTTIREAYRLVTMGDPGHIDIIRAEARFSERFRLALIVHRLRWEDRIQSWEADLQEAQWHCLKAILKASDFWDLPYKGTRIGMGGYSAYLEGHREGTHHEVWRWCPRHRDDQDWFELPCCYLTDLAQLLVPEKADPSP